MLRKLALSLAIAGVLGVPNANALGLGEINISSALNEPLSAEIRLMQVRDLSPLQIQPRMADADEFSIAGLSKSRFLNDVRFQVHVTPDGAGIIRMTSTEPVREPFLNFLVEVNWPNGRLVREYTVLLDPPLFDPAPIRGQVQPAATSAPVVPTTAPTRTTTEPRTLPTTANQIHVGANDTLWVLANRHRPDSSITPQQMMVALQRHNPQTFPTANINIMRAGTVMDIPSIEQIRALSAAEASAEVARQTEVWREGRAQPAAPQPAAPQPAPEPEATTPEVVEESPVASEPESEPEVAADAEALAEAAEALADAELRIVTPEEVVEAEQESPVAGDMASRDEVVLSSEVADGLLQRSEDLDSRLMVTQETVDKIERENRDLNEKLDAIQEQLVLMQRMLELKEQQLAAMQAVEPEPPAEQGLADKLTSMPVVGGLAAALVAALAALLLSRRRRDNTPKPLFTAPEGASGDKAKVAATAAGVAVAATVAAKDDEAEQFEAENIEEVMTPASVDSEDDFSDLDLDLDLDLELNEEDSTRVIDEEYDLSAENDFGDLLDETELGDEPVADEEVTPEVEVEVEPEAEPKADQGDEDELLDDMLNYDEPELNTGSVEPSEDHSEDDLGSLDDLLMSNMSGEDEKLADEEPGDAEPAAQDDADDLDFILSEPEEPQAEVSDEADKSESTADDDLDDLLGSMEFEEVETDTDSSVAKKPGEKVEDELTANIAHDLESDLDDELNDMLSSTDDDIALEESQSADEAIDMLDGLNLLDGADENETKLDLARAYLEMDDAEGAREILGEILGEGNDKQKEEAQKLLDGLS